MKWNSGMAWISRCKAAGLLIAMGALIAVPGCAEIGALLNPVPQEEILGASFARMEQRLLDAHQFELRYVITAEGAFNASLEGGMRLESGNIAEIWGTGSFGGEFVDFSLDSDGHDIYVSYDDGAYDSSTPAELNRAIVIGLTRMGLLHNLARLLSGQLPDHASGGVGEWVQVHDFATGPEQLLDNGVRNAKPTHFNLSVDGTPSGRATIWEAPGLGVPIGRDQIVQFETDEMRVKERYSAIILRDEPREITIEGD